MAKLTASERAKLPDSAFAYVGTDGRRRLPINDASHVRNALARFGQVAFESEDARATARRRLLNAARRHGIVPVGFIDGEIRSVRSRAAAGRLVIELSRIGTLIELQGELRRTLGDRTLTLLRWSKLDGAYVDCVGEPVALPADGLERTITYLQGRDRPMIAITHARSVLRSDEITEAVMAAVHLVTGKELLAGTEGPGSAAEGLPEGIVTFLLTDIEGSTSLLHALADDYAALLGQVRGVIREAVLRHGGRQVEARADEFVAVFAEASAAVAASADIQRGMTAHPWADDHDVRVRLGLHTGDIRLTESGYVGLTVHIAARIMASAHGGQVLASAATRDAAGDVPGVAFRSLGRFELRGLTGPHQLLQLESHGLAHDFPPPAV